MLGFSPNKNNFLPSSYLHNCTELQLEIVNRTKIAIPINLPLLTNFFNKLFRLPVLNLFCVSSITILKKIQKKIEKSEDQVVSFIIPCKDEEKNIPQFQEKLLTINKNYEFLFGDDKSKDDTKNQIAELCKK